MYCLLCAAVFLDCTLAFCATQCPQTLWEWAPCSVCFMFQRSRTTAKLLEVSANAL
jgi:hypothetical protein